MRLTVGRGATDKVAKCVNKDKSHIQTGDRVYYLYACEILEYNHSYREHCQQIVQGARLLPTNADAVSEGHAMTIT